MSSRAQLLCPGCGDTFDEVGQERLVCYKCKRSWTRSELAASEETQASEEGRPFLASGPVLVTLSDVEREEVSWLWTGRIPRSSLTALSGNPGVGKSWLSLAVATAVTLGAPLPGDTERREPERVLLLTGEDGLGNTVRPRLDDMGADVTRVVALTAVRDADGADDWPSLGEHLPMIDGALNRGGFGLLIIDPLNAFLGSGLDYFRDNAIRGVLGPVAQLAERHKVAVLLVSHLTKSRRDTALYRTQGSIGYVGAPRSVLMAGKDQETGEHGLIWIKGNLTAAPPSVGYAIEDGRFSWRGESTLTAADILAPDAEAGDRSAVEEAVDFLRDALADGARPGKDVTREAAALGISGATLRRARQRLGVRWEQPGKVGAKGRSEVVWLPPDDLDAHTHTLSKQIQIVSEDGADSLKDEQANTHGPLVRAALEIPGVRLARNGSGS